LSITKAVTDQYIPAWFMHKSHSRVKNNKTFFATFNSNNAFNDDILNRIVVVRMSDGRDTTVERKATISKLMEGFLDNREKIVADILWHLKQLKRPVSVIRHIKFAKWSETAANWLSTVYPELNEFDFSLSSEDDELNEDSNLINDFLDEQLNGAKKVYVPNTELLEKYKIFYGNQKITKTGMNRHLDNMSKSLKKYSISKGDCQMKGLPHTRGWNIERL